ncbi:MAG: signal peptidase II [Oscillospiraceae bacterium]|nr:signal peptidase II [Oscillospiraceae bacterium]
MQFLFMSLFALGIVGIDQLTKYLVVSHIALFADVPFLPGFLGLTYVRNTGAAFSMLEGQRWLFIAVFAVMTVLIFWEYFKKPLPFTKLERWCIAAIYGGGVGNMIDRISRGFVVDMIQTEFIEFPVFNVADCFITCGCILLLVHLLFFNKAFWKEEKK